VPHRCISAVDLIEVGDVLQAVRKTDGSTEFARTTKPHVLISGGQLSRGPLRRGLCRLSLRVNYDDVTTNVLLYCGPLGYTPAEK